jgi:ABC-type dipeptide/oligopeptide/nickel transport system permease component
MQSIAEDGPDAGAAQAELVRLGGAALPHVIAALDGFDPERRARVAVALAPLAARMRLPNADDAQDPERATGLWRRFWDDRGVEFKPASVRTAIDRLARYRTPSRAAELEALDTFVLPAVFERLPTPRDERTRDVARSLLDLAARVTGRPDVIREQASIDEAAACVARWRAWWLIHESDFRQLDGTARAAAMLKETRYGKWAAAAVLDLSTHEVEGLALGKLARGAPVTLTILFGAIAIAYSVGITIGVLTAQLRRRRTDLAVGVSVVVLYATPTAALAAIVLGLGADRGSLFWPTLIVAAGLCATPARQQRTGIAEAMAREHVLAARARGSTRLRALLFHAARQALLTTITLLTVEPPTALAAVFVAEAAFGLDGVGAAVVRAVAERDTSLLMLLSLLAAVVASLVVLASDLAQAALDPRVRGRLAGGAG